MEFDVNKPLRVFEAFGGYGSQSLAFKRLKEYFPEFDFKVVGYSDIEPTAITAYMALHKGENIINYGDISQIMLLTHIQTRCLEIVTKLIILPRLCVNINTH